MEVSNHNQTQAGNTQTDSYQRIPRASGSISTGRHPCAVCRKSYLTKQHLQRHMLIHTGDKPFFCDICGKRFNQQSTVKTHKMVHLKRLLQQDNDP